VDGRLARINDVDDNFYNETKIRVRYAETDRMGVVYYGNFFTWFEVGRVEFLRDIGFRYREVEEVDDCHIVVVEAQCRYRSPARYDDELLIRTRLKHLRGPVVRFGYEIVRADDGAEVADGETTHLVCDRQMKVRPLPPKLADPLRERLLK
jgi:acyl-CoA thioester hydrolase